jgi:hypothetical protein
MACCDEHHPLGRAHAPRIVIDACRFECHRVLSERQLRAGVVLDHGVERSDVEDVWALLSGVGDELFLLAHSAPSLGPEAARAGEALMVQLGRLLDMVAREAGEDGIGGPEPRRTGMRVARRGGSERCAPRRKPPRYREATERPRTQAIASVVASALSTVVPEGVARDEVDLAVLVATRFGAIADRLAELEACGRGNDLRACFAYGRGLLAALTGELQGLATLDGWNVRESSLVGVGAYAKPALQFVRELAQAPDTSSAEQALDRLLAAADLI